MHQRQTAFKNYLIPPFSFLTQLYSKSWQDCDFSLLEFFVSVGLNPSGQGEVFTSCFRDDVFLLQGKTKQTNPKYPPGL